MSVLITIGQANYIFVFTDDHKRTCVRILSVHVCFGKPVQRAPDLLNSLSASQGVTGAFLEQLSGDLLSSTLRR